MDQNQIVSLAKSIGAQLVETHISWVLVGKNAYKIKKPVQFSFLDFSTIEKRKFFCMEEVRLNNRLSEGIYLGVVPILQQANGVVALGSQGSDSGDQVIDYAVEMNVLDQSKLMSKLLVDGKVSQADVKKLAAVVVAFHSKIPSVSGNYGSPELVWGQIADLDSHKSNIQEATGLGGAVDEVLSACRKFIDGNSSFMEQRVKQSMVKDCHGDLHSGNIVLDGKPIIFDCIEFNTDFRCVDVASDMAFMAMDLDAHGRSDLAKLFEDEYLAKSHDVGAKKLLDFYKCYRANVRAKVAAIEWSYGKSPEAQERIVKYLKLAVKYAKRLI